MIFERNCLLGLLAAALLAPLMPRINMSYISAS